MPRKKKYPQWKREREAVAAVTDVYRAQLPKVYGTEDIPRRLVGRKIMREEAKRALKRKRGSK